MSEADRKELPVRLTRLFDVYLTRVLWIGWYGEKEVEGYGRKRNQYR